MALKTDMDDHIALVYVIGTHQDGPVKIGLTSQIVSRVLTLQIGNPDRLKIFGARFASKVRNDTIRTPSLRACFRFGAEALERLVHAQLDEFDLRLIGEWFDISAKEALQVIEKVSQKEGIRCVGLEHLAGADISGRADAAMGAVHNKLLHEAFAIQTYIHQHNNA